MEISAEIDDFSQTQRILLNPKYNNRDSIVFESYRMVLRHSDYFLYPVFYVSFFGTEVDS